MKSLLSICLLLLLMAGPGASMAGPVNINTADAATLAAELDGVGPRIVEANRDNILTSREPATN